MSTEIRPTAARPVTLLAYPLAAALVVVAALTLGPARVDAQCAVCGNPAFSAGDNDVARVFDDAAAGATRLRAGLVYAAWEYADIYSGSTALSEAAKRSQVFTPDWALQIHVATLLAGVELASGTEIGLTLPFGVASATRVPELGDGESKDDFGTPLTTTHDSGLSDLELRARQHVNALVTGLPKWAPRLSIALGAVAPTGSFIVKDPEGATTDQYASLGRGAWWGLGELDLTGRIGSRLGWLVGVGARLPLTTNVNKGYLFRWGDEVRGTAGLTGVLLRRALHASLAVEWQWRSSGQERIFADTPIEDFANGGGDWLTLQPALQWQVTGSLSLLASARIPLWRKVNGFQPVPGLGVVVGLWWNWPTATPAARTQPESVVELLASGIGDS